VLIAPALRLTSSFVQECLGSQALERYLFILALRYVCHVTLFTVLDKYSLIVSICKIFPNNQNEKNNHTAILYVKDQNTRLVWQYLAKCTCISHLCYAADDQLVIAVGSCYVSL